MQKCLMKWMFLDDVFIFDWRSVCYASERKKTLQMIWG